MELEEMKSLWGDMDQRLNKQKTLTDDIILKMTQEKSRNRLSRIVYAESFGVLVTVAGLVYILMHFGELQSSIELYCGIGTAWFLVLGIALGLTVIQKARKINLADSTYTQTIIDFNAFRKFLGFYKRIGIALNLASPFLLLPVVYRIFLHKDLLGEFEELSTGLGVGLLIGFILGGAFFYAVVQFYRGNISSVKKVFNEYNDITQR